MKRDWDIIRAILLEAAAGDCPPYSEIEDDVLEEHGTLLQENGYLNAKGQLTQEGLDFLHIALDPEDWRWAKRAVSEACGGIPSAALIAYLRGSSPPPDV